MERRRERRTAVGIPVKVRARGRTPEPAESSGVRRLEHSGVTRDLSTSGIFLYSDSAFEPGTKLELVMMLPAELGLGPGGWTMCEASVVRVEESDGKSVGVAARLDRIGVLPELS